MSDSGRGKRRCRRRVTVCFIYMAASAWVWLLHLLSRDSAWHLPRALVNCAREVSASSAAPPISPADCRRPLETIARAGPVGDEEQLAEGTRHLPIHMDHIGSIACLCACSKLPAKTNAAAIVPKPVNRSISSVLRQIVVLCHGSGSTARRSVISLNAVARGFLSLCGKIARKVILTMNLIPLALCGIIGDSCR